MISAHDILKMASCKSRRREYVDYRRAVAALLANEGFTVQSVGEFLGGRDHSTVIYLRDTDFYFKDDESYKPIKAEVESVAGIIKDEYRRFINSKLRRAAS